MYAAWWVVLLIISSIIYVGCMCVIVVIKAFTQLLLYLHRKEQNPNQNINQAIEIRVL